VASIAAGTGVLEEPPPEEPPLEEPPPDGTAVGDGADPDGVAVADDPHATATINNIAATIGSRVLTLSNLCLDM
jgi:hypothetical protein